jgi:hypothetical protein
MRSHFCPHRRICEGGACVRCQQPQLLPATWGGISATTAPQKWTAD